MKLMIVIVLLIVGAVVEVLKELRDFKVQREHKDGVEHKEKEGIKVLLVLDIKGLQVFVDRQVEILVIQVLKEVLAQQVRMG
jgi:hypothetical protein